MNNLITSFLDEYIINPDPQFAVFLKGKWGCGKTHYITNWLKKYQDIDESDDVCSITLEPLYVSLYGLNSISEIKTAIDREINPFFYSKTGKILKGVASILGKVVLKTSIDFNGDGNSDASFSGSIDSLSVFHSKEDVVSGCKFIVFDDIERSQIEMKSLLGFINYFVEHCDCHVIIVGDDTQITEKQKEALDEFKEKTIGREFTIGPDTGAAVDCFLSEPYFSEYLLTERDYIIKCFDAAGNENLRVLRQCLMDFSTQIRTLDEESLNEGRLFLHGLLGSFIAVYAELNSKENRDIFSDYATFYQLGVYGLKEENGKRFKALNQKYNGISQGCIYHALSVEYVQSIVNHILTGESLCDYIQKHINDDKKSYASWERLSGFWELDNEAFATLYNDVVDSLINERIDLPYQIGTTIGYLGYIDKKGVKTFTKTNLNRVRRYLRKRINDTQDLWSLYQIRLSLIQGMNYISMCEDGLALPVVTACADAINKAFEKRRRVLPDEMQLALRSLSEKNVYGLIEIDDKVYPDHCNTYQQRAIFEHEDADMLFERISSLSNKGKNYFCSFLSKHYMFGAKLVDFASFFSGDEKVLLRLEEHIKGIIPSAKGVDFLAYERLDEALLKAIKRSRGDGNALE